MPISLLAQQSMGPAECSGTRGGKRPRTRVLQRRVRADSELHSGSMILLLIYGAQCCIAACWRSLSLPHAACGSHEPTRLQGSSRAVVGQGGVIPNPTMLSTSCTRRQQITLVPRVIPDTWLTAICLCDWTARILAQKRLVVRQGAVA